MERFELTDQKPCTVETPYGSAELKTGKLDGREIAFLSRHGRGHAVPPHLVNYRANIWALHSLGVKKILATAAVGSLAAKYQTGDLVLLDQFLDFTKQRAQTFYEGGAKGVLHVDLTEPYCSAVRQVILAAAGKIGIVVKDGACYVCTEGPRFETPAEIRMFQILGGEVVGMTSVPEVVLARELGICYAAVGLVTNEAAGIAAHTLSHSEVIESLQSSELKAAELLKAAFAALTAEQSCGCPLANQEVGKF